MRSAPFLRLDPKSSRLARIGIAAMGSLALASIALSALGLVVAVAMATLCIAAALHADRKQRSPALRHAVLQSDGSWLLSIVDGKGVHEVTATLVSSALLGPLAALYWRDVGGQRIDALLWPDAMPDAVHRQLRVWLMSGRAHRVAPQ